MSLHDYSHSWREEDAKEAPKEAPKTNDDDDDGWGLRKDVSAMAGTPRATRGAASMILPEADELVSNILSKSDAALSIQRVLRGHVGRKRALRLTGRQKMTTKKIEGKDERVSDNSKNGNIPLSLFQDTPEAALFDGDRKFSHDTIVGEPLFNEDILKALAASVAADTQTRKQWRMKRTQSLTDLLQEGASQHESNEDIFTRSSSSPYPMIPGTCTCVCVCVCVCLCVECVRLAFPTCSTF
jgi:hypothetical protein